MNQLNWIHLYRSNAEPNREPEALSAAREELASWVGLDWVEKEGRSED